MTSPAKPAHPALDQRHAGRAARGVDGVAGGEGVRAVDHEVLALDERGRVVRDDPHAVGLDHDVRVEEAQLGRGALRLGHADVRREVQQLAVEVGQLDRVVVEDAEPPDARARQVQRHGGAERARADHEHARLAHGRLLGEPPLGQRELAPVALELGVGERERRERPRVRGRRARRGHALRRPAPRRAARSRKKPRRLFIARTMRIVVPSTSTAWPAARRSGARSRAPRPGGSAPRAPRRAPSARAPAWSAPTSSGT